jgi:hypothetical protein
MPRIRVKVEINKGGVGVKLHKLADIAEQSLSFFNMLCQDAGLETSKEEWIARNFGNDCVDYLCETEGDFPTQKVSDYNTGLRSIISEEFTPSCFPFQVRRGTIRQFSNIAASLVPGEVISFGVFRDPTGDDFDWLSLSKEKASRIQKEIPEFVKYYASAQGIVHALHKESDDPHITIREQVSHDLVKCYFSEGHYDEIVNLLKDKQAVVYVEGMISENVITGAIDSIQSELYRVLQPLSYSDLDAIFGTDESMREKLMA